MADGALAASSFSTAVMSGKPSFASQSPARPTDNTPPSERRNVNVAEAVGAEFMNLSN
jgi:hypothetical protein